MEALTRVVTQRVDLAALAQLNRSDAEAAGSRLDLVTQTQVETRTRDFPEGQKRPVMPRGKGLIHKLTQCLSDNCISPSSVDFTGREPKITFSANVERTICESHATLHQHRYLREESQVLLTVGLKRTCTPGVNAGSGYMYAAPGIEEEIFKQQGAWDDKMGQINFYNRLGNLNGSFGTACAYQLAIYYVRYHISPRLLSSRTRDVFGSVPGKKHNESPSAHHSCFMPGELIQRHSKESLSLTYHALEAKDIMAAAGFPNLERVYNRCNDLPSTEFSLDTFWESFAICCMTFCGTGSYAQFEADFLMGLTNAMPLHGKSFEGGIWREAYRQFIIQPNMCVVVSNLVIHTVGYTRFTDAQVIFAAANLQACISRTIFETPRDTTVYMAAPGVNNDIAREALAHLLPDIKEGLAEATDLPVAFWDNCIGRSMLISQFANRHISTTHANYFGEFSGITSTYATPMSGELMGDHVVNMASANWLTFSGSCKTTSVLTADNEIFYVGNMLGPRTPNNFLYWADPGIMMKDGLSDITYDCSSASDAYDLVDYEPLADGLVLNTGDALVQGVWNTALDLVPPLGSLRNASKNQILLKWRNMPSYLMEGEYEIKVWKYAAVNQMRGESKKAKVVNGENVNSRIYLYLKKLRLLREWTGAGEARQSLKSLQEYLRVNKKLTKRQIVAYVASIPESRVIDHEEDEGLEDALSPITSPNIDEDGEDELRQYTVQYHSAYIALELVGAMRALGTMQDVSSMAAMLAAGTVIQAYVDSVPGLQDYSEFTFITTESNEAVTRQGEREAAAEGTRSSRTGSRVVYGSESSPRVWDESIYYSELLAATADLNASAERLREEAEEFLQLYYTGIRRELFFDGIRQMVAEKSETMRDRLESLIEAANIDDSSSRVYTKSKSSLGMSSLAIRVTSGLLRGGIKPGLQSPLALGELLSEKKELARLAQIELAHAKLDSLAPKGKRNKHTDRQGDSKPAKGRVTINLPAQKRETMQGMRNKPRAVGPPELFRPPGLEDLNLGAYGAEATDVNADDSVWREMATADSNEGDTGEQSDRVQMEQPGQKAEPRVAETKEQKGETQPNPNVPAATSNDSGEGGEK
jgi:hypothetical protein